MKQITCDICFTPIPQEDMQMAVKAMVFMGEELDLCAPCRNWVHNGIQKARQTRGKGRYKQPSKILGVAGSIIGTIKGAAENYAANQGGSR